MPAKPKPAPPDPRQLPKMITIDHDTRERIARIQAAYPELSDSAAIRYAVRIAAAALAAPARRR